MRTLGLSLVLYLAANADARPPTIMQTRPLGLQAATAPLLVASPVSQPSSLVSGVTAWAEQHAAANWFPWMLALIGFGDYFVLCGFLLTPLLTLALMAAPGVQQMSVLCAFASAGCLAGSFAFSILMSRLGLTDKAAGSPQLAVAHTLLKRHGALAGVMNTLLPLPTIPLIIAAHAVGANVPWMLIAMAVGRAARYIALTFAILSSRKVARAVGESVERRRREAGRASLAASHAG